MSRTAVDRERLIAAVEQRVGWAREILASPDWTDLEKIWVRRYEMDVPALVDALRTADAEDVA